MTNPDDALRYYERQVKTLGELQQEKADEVRHSVELQAAAREAYCKGFYDGFKMAREMQQVARDAQGEAGRYGVEMWIEVMTEIGVK